MFYREVVQSVLLFGSELWVTLEAMERTVEGMHKGFLQHITEKRARKN